METWENPPAISKAVKNQIKNLWTAICFLRNIEKNLAANLEEE